MQYRVLKKYGLGAEAGLDTDQKQGVFSTALTIPITDKMFR
jgi:hypothetical protein